MTFLPKRDAPHSQSPGWDYKPQQTPQALGALQSSFPLSPGSWRQRFRLPHTAGLSVFSSGDGARPTAGGGVRRRIPPPRSAGGRGAGQPGQRAGDRAATTARAAMEGDGVRWGSEPVSGPGPGGGGMLRDLCRSFGRYRRYLGRLRQNLRETQKFFHDVKGSHSRGCPSSPTGDGGAQRGPAGDVAEPGLQAGKAGGREGGRAGQADGRADRTPALQNNPGKRRAGREGRVAGLVGLCPPRPRGLGRASPGAGEGRPGLGRGVGLGPGGARRHRFQEQDPGKRAWPVLGRAGRGVTRGVGKVALSWGLGRCGSESPFRDGGVERWRRGSRQGTPGA